MLKKLLNGSYSNNKLRVSYSAGQSYKHPPKYSQLWWTTLQDISILASPLFIARQHTDAARY